MDDFRRHARWCPRGVPPTGRRLDVFPDYSAFPVWEVGGMSPPGRLGISEALAADLMAWRVWWEEHSEYGGGRSATAEQRATWDADGAALAERLARETGAAVVYDWRSRRSGDCC